MKPHCAMNLQAQGPLIVPSMELGLQNQIWYAFCDLSSYWQSPGHSLARRPDVLGLLGSNGPSERGRLRRATPAGALRKLCLGFLPPLKQDRCHAKRVVRHDQVASAPGSTCNGASDDLRPSAGGTTTSCAGGDTTTSAVQAGTTISCATSAAGASIGSGGTKALMM